MHLHQLSTAHCPWVSTTLQPRTPVRPLQRRFPAPCVEHLRVSSTKLRLAPHALFLTSPSQISCTGKMPRETVFSTKVQINWADSENSGQFVSLTVKLLPKSCEVVVGVTLETHHLAQETCAPRFRRLFLLLRQSPATTQPRSTFECSLQTLSFSLSRTGSDCTRGFHLQKTEDAFCVRCLTAPPLCAPGSITDPINSSFRSHTILWPRTAKVSPSISMELLQ